MLQIMSVFYESEEAADAAAENYIARAELQDFVYRVYKYKYVSNNNYQANDKVKGNYSC